MNTFGRIVAVLAAGCLLSALVMFSGAWRNPSLATRSKSRDTVIGWLCGVVLFARLLVSVGLK
jgi:hypothetical protein